MKINPLFMEMQGAAAGLEILRLIVVKVLHAWNTHRIETDPERIAWREEQRRRRSELDTEDPGPVDEAALRESYYLDLAEREPRLDDGDAYESNFPLPRPWL